MSYRGGFQMSAGTCEECGDSFERKYKDNRSKWCPKAKCQESSGNRRSQLMIVARKRQLLKKANMKKHEGWRKCQADDLLGEAKRRECCRVMPPGGNLFFCVSCHPYVTGMICSGVLE